MEWQILMSVGWQIVLWVVPDAVMQWVVAVDAGIQISKDAVATQVAKASPSRWR